MTTNIDKFKSLVSDNKGNTIKRNKERIKNRARLRESQQIALKVLNKLDELGWSQKRLAEEMEVSPQQITKLVRGSENLTLETQVKLQEILDIPILATYYEREVDKVIVTIKFEILDKYKIPAFELLEEDIIIPKKEITNEYNIETLEFKNYSMSA